MPNSYTMDPSTLQGWRTSTTAPASPEQIFFADTNPGSCWPMAGRHGHVTIRLPYPVDVDAITIDHVSSLLIPPGGSRDSAPKKIRVMGYPPCEENECNGLGFDISDGIEGKLQLGTSICPYILT